MTQEEYGPTTKALLASRGQVVSQHPLAAPLHMASTFAFDDLDEFAAVARSKTTGGYLYSRWANPTVDRLCAMVASLEGAAASAAFASGMAAISTTLAALVRAGDHVVTSSQVYGGTHGLFDTALARAGVTCTRVDVTDLEQVADAFTAETKVLYAETLGNPTLVVADLEGLAALAHERDALFVVDATTTPPVMLRPLEHGVDLSIHSATKYLGGHSDMLAGVVSGSEETIDAIRRLSLDIGGVCAPMDAWLCARGIETLDLRMERTCSTTLTLARALESVLGPGRVQYPGLDSHPQHDLAKRLLGDRFGGLLSFDTGSFEAGRRFLSRVAIAQRAASLGGTKTLVVHPASVTHTQLTPEQRAAVGIGEGVVRVAVGIEDEQDLLDDFTQALA